MCNKCQAKQVPAPNIDKTAEHTYEHALVRCQPLHSPTHIEDDKEDKIKELEKTVGNIGEKLTRLEDSLEKVQAVLSLFLTKIDTR